MCQVKRQVDRSTVQHRNLPGLTWQKGEVMPASRSLHASRLATALLCLLLAAGPAFSLAAAPADMAPMTPGATITVNTSVDGINDGDGFCSLREAITAANTNAAVDACPSGSGADTINFSIGAGVVTITLGSALPPVSSPVLIDGSTQPGYVGTPLVRIDWSGTALGLSTSNNSTVRALDLSYYRGGTGTRGISVVASSNVTLENLLIAHRNNAIYVRRPSPMGSAFT